MLEFIIRELRRHQPRSICIVPFNTTDDEIQSVYESISARCTDAFVFIWGDDEQRCCLDHSYLKHLQVDAVLFLNRQSCQTLAKHPDLKLYHYFTYDAPKLLFALSKFLSESDVETSQKIGVLYSIDDSIKDTLSELAPFFKQLKVVTQDELAECALKNDVFLIYLGFQDHAFRQTCSLYFFAHVLHIDISTSKFSMYLPSSKRARSLAGQYIGCSSFYFLLDTFDSTLLQLAYLLKAVLLEQDKNVKIIALTKITDQRVFNFADITNIVYFGCPTNASINTIANAGVKIITPLELGNSLGSDETFENHDALFKYLNSMQRTGDALVEANDRCINHSGNFFHYFLVSIMSNRSFTGLSCDTFESKILLGKKGIAKHYANES